jgi:hypothetical protein
MAEMSLSDTEKAQATSGAMSERLQSLSDTGKATSGAMSERLLLELAISILEHTAVW